MDIHAIADKISQTLIVCALVLAALAAASVVFAAGALFATFAGMPSEFLGNLLTAAAGCGLLSVIAIAICGLAIPFGTHGP